MRKYYYGKLKENVSKKTYYANIDGAIRQVKIDRIKYHEDRDGNLCAEILLNVAGIGTKWFTDSVYVYESVEDCINNDTEYLIKPIEFNVADDFNGVAKNFTDIYGVSTDRFYRYSLNESKTAVEVVDMPFFEGEPIVIDERGWHYMNPFYNEKVEKWIKSTKSCRDELVKDANVVTFDDANNVNVKAENEDMAYIAGFVDWSKWDNEETDNNGDCLDEIADCVNNLMEFLFGFKHGGGK